MAPPAKASKSDVTLKVYILTRDLRRNIDNADRMETDAKIQEYNEALTGARKLVTYLQSKLDEKLVLNGANDVLLRTLNADARTVANNILNGRG